MMATSILDLVCAPWAVLPEWGDHIYAIYQRWAEGGQVDLSQIAARSGTALKGPQPGGYEVRDGVAILQMQGTLSQRINMMANVSGGTSTELLTRDIRNAAQDPKVKGLILIADTPGGAVAGTPGAAAALYQAREIKPTAMLVDELSASAGYWIGSAASRIYLGSTVSQAGSIGVMSRHVSRAGALEAAGINVTEIYAGKYKTVGSDTKDLSKEDKAILQEKVDTLYSIFVNDVARNRGQSVERVLADMADGKLFIGQQAIDAGLADGFSTMDDLVAEIADRAKWRSIMPSKSAATGPPAAAALPLPQPRMTLSTEVAQWAAENPEAAAALRAEGASAERQKFTTELESARAAARAEGALAEAERAADVRAQGLPGHEALTERLAADGHTTGPEAAMAMVAAERELKAQVAADRQAEVPSANTFAHGDSKNESGQPDSPEAVKEKARRISARAFQIQAEAKSQGRTISSLVAVQQAQTELNIKEVP